MDAAALGWNEFYVAAAGAAAALAGLLIVAMSVNIQDILKSKSIPMRGASAIAGLTAAVAACCLGLVPGQSLRLLGIEITIAAITLIAIWVQLLRAVLAERVKGYPLAPKYGVAALAPIGFSVAGILLLLESTAGLYWVAGASIISIVAGVVFAWVALIEILR